MSNEVIRRAIVEEAYRWIGTPWRHNMALKGVGADCAMFPLAVAKELHLVPQDYDAGAYAINHFLHRSEEIFIEQLEKLAHRIDAKDAGPGDVILYRVGHTASHAAIIVDDNQVIHSHRRSKSVRLHERTALAQEMKVDSYWSVLPP